MKKKMLLAFQILTKIIIILLALSTFFIQQDNPDNYSENFFVKLFSLDHYYGSWLNLALFSLLALLILVSIFVKRFISGTQLILHVIILLAFIIVIYDKTMNFREIMPIKENQTVNFSEIVENKNYDQKIHLEKFSIEYHKGGRMPKAFTSKLIINNSDTVLLNVNKPVKIGTYRLYQNAYDKVPVYKIIFKDNEYNIVPDDTLQIKEHYALIELSEDRKTMVFHFNDHEKRLSPMGGEFSIEDFQFDLSVDSVKFISYIEVAAVRGMKVLLLLAIAYLFMLGYGFWREQS